MSNLSVNTITNAAGGNTAQINGMTPTGLSLQGFRNRLFNGGMVIDQRNNGASITPSVSGTYTVDRWVTGFSQASKFSVQQNAGSVAPPAGFTNYLGATSTSAYSVGAAEGFVVAQFIEGFNISDVGWGTANAQPVTLSFWVRSSLTGTFGGSLRNSDANRSYPFSYTINAANTWEQKSVTIAGDASGTWLTNNAIGIRLSFSLGAGATSSGTAGAWAAGSFVSATGSVSVVSTSGATFFITGVQLEAGSVATPFERRPFGTELALCQRYFQIAGTGVTGVSVGVTMNLAIKHTVEMRATPSAATSGVVRVSDLITAAAVQTTASAPTQMGYSSTLGTWILLSDFSPSLTSGRVVFVTSNATDALPNIRLSAEL